MHQGRVEGLGLQVGLPAVPHDAIEKLQVGGRKRAPVERRLGGGGFRTLVRVGDGDDAELGIGRHRQCHANQSMIQQLAVCRGGGRESGDVVAGAIGAVKRAKYRVRALGVIEALLQVCGSDTPSVGGIMTTGAAPAVAPQAGKKRTGFINLLLAESLDRCRWNPERIPGMSLGAWSEFPPVDPPPHAVSLKPIPRQPPTRLAFDSLLTGPFCFWFPRRPAGTPGRWTANREFMGGEFAGEET